MDNTYRSKIFLLLYNRRLKQCPHPRFSDCAKPRLPVRCTLPAGDFEFSPGIRGDLLRLGWTNFVTGPSSSRPMWYFSLKPDGPLQMSGRMIIGAMYTLEPLTPEELVSYV